MRNLASSSSSVIPRCFSSESETIAKKKVEDVMPIATRHEKEEIEVELEGRRLLDMDFPEGLFGTKEAPAIVKSSYDKHIMGCLGGEGRMNTTLCGSGWRKESLFNARFAHSTLS
ncbi:cytochrome c oxidase subunit 5b-1, mitochondrial-like isoform X2 [Brassica rapa]|uniref:cytochrome c oxidase subunit 5b-1, mitochondrial-like isoform X2 n=1 Tax=Brassica campestris TaxID=3711 RepID=UPI00142E5A9B|nr:cytochrome c oxidase subunit 5b-1, mitochondrial-like isoform X2 [Brassica rapa]